MDVRKLELKSLKRADKQAKRKLVSAWKTVTILLMVAAALLAPMCVTATMFDNELALVLQQNFWSLKNPVSDTYQTEEIAGDACLQAQIEGIVLLKNENQALPLQAGTTIELLGNNGFGVSLAQMGFLQTVGADTAILSVSGTEGGWALDREELQKALDRKVNGQLKTLILLISAQMPVDREILKNDGIDSILWIGSAEAEAVAKVLTGVSPSGALVDTWCSGNFPTGQMGVYSGYKYYETRYEDYVMGTGNAGDFQYGEAVLYPFGTGLRYTEFEWSDLQAEYDGKTDRYSLSVTVTNKGNTSGKDILQVYAQTPYTDYDKQFGVEKPAVQLVGFAKTSELLPNASEQISVYVDRRDLASYDAQGAGTYILDAGKYYLTLAADAHDAVNNILSAKGYTPENTDGRMDGEGNGVLTYTWQENALDAKTYCVSKGGAEIGNIFPAVKDTCVSRQDWEGTLSRAAEPMHLTQKTYSPADYPHTAMPTVGAENGLKLYDMVGLAFDDPKWQTLLDQLTFDDMLRLVTDGHGFMMPIASVESPGAKKSECILPVSENLLAASFNAELMYAIGKNVGNTALRDGNMVIYGFAGGYEDSFLAGKLRAAQVRGIGEKGIAVVLKAAGKTAFSNEQAAREGCWRQFQYPLEETSIAGVAEGVLPAALLRQEWGNRGMVTAEKYPAAEDVLAGVTSYGVTTRSALAKYENDPVVVTALRQACRYNLFTLANSAAMNGIGENTTVQVRQLPVVTGLWVALAVSMVLLIPFAFLWGRGRKMWKKTDAHLAYKTLKNTLKAEKKANKKLPE